MTRELFAVINLDEHDDPAVSQVILQTLAAIVGEHDKLCYTLEGNVLIVWRECHVLFGFQP